MTIPWSNLFHRTKPTAKPPIVCGEGTACYRHKKWSLPPCAGVCVRKELLRGLESCR